MRYRVNSNFTGLHFPNFHESVIICENKVLRKFRDTNLLHKRFVHPVATIYGNEGAEHMHHLYLYNEQVLEHMAVLPVAKFVGQNSNDLFLVATLEKGRGREREDTGKVVLR